MSDGPLCDKCEQPSDGDFLRVCRKCAERAGAKVKELEEENAEKDRLLRVDVDNNVLLVEKLERAEVRVKELERERGEARPVLEAARFEMSRHTQAGTVARLTPLTVSSHSCQCGLCGSFRAYDAARAEKTK